MQENQNNQHYTDPKMPFIYSAIFAIILIFAGLFGDGIWEKYQNHSRERFVEEDKQTQFTAIYDEFWNIVNDNYYAPNFDGVDWAAQYEIGVKAASAAKDRADFYSRVIQKQIDLFPVSHLAVFPNMSEADVKEALRNKSDFSMLERGLFLGGINIIDIKRGNKKYDIVEDVIAGSPADIAGAQIGWSVVNWRYEYDENQNPIHFYGEFRPEIIEEDLSNLNTQPIIAIDFPLGEVAKRSESEIKNLAGKTYVRFDNFMDSAEIDNVRAVFAACNPNGIIIDLRKNGGGDLMEMQRAISPLLPRHTLIMHTKTRTKSQTFHSSWFDKQCKTKLVVLIGPNSASAAEIMAQTLSYYKRAILIGRPTNGSVIGAYDYVLMDGTLLQIPTLHILAADGSRIEGGGVKPDLYVLPNQAQIRARRDEAIARAIDALNN